MPEACAEKIGGKASCVWFPVFEDRDELAHHHHCARFFLPPEGCRALFWSRPGVLRPGEIPETPPYCVKELPTGVRQPLDVELHNATDGLGQAAADADFVFLWDSRAREALGEVRGAVISVDRNHTQWDCYNYPMFMDRLMSKPERATMSADSHQRFLARLRQLEADRAQRPCYVFGTGPSVMSAYEYDFSNGFRVVCNTIIKNTRMMEHLRPHFLVAADAIYHYGISRYARRFQDDLREHLLRTDCMLVLQEVLASNYLRLYPELSDNVLSVPYVYDYEPTVSLRERWLVTPFHNVLNQFLLPLASSLSDVVALLGFDGRKSNDTHFWGTDESVNYEDLKPQHQLAHPGFFAQMEYARYAEEMAETSERIMAYGEERGKRYVCLNESSNHALQRRRGDSRGL